MATTLQRRYGLSDLKRLMATAGQWASGWDDILLYLDSPAKSIAGLSHEAREEMRADFRTLQREDFEFTRDHREIWNELDALSVRGGLSHEPTESATASSRVANVMHRLGSREYQEMADRFARNRDAGWNQD